MARCMRSSSRGFFALLRESLSYRAGLLFSDTDVFVEILFDRFCYTIFIRTQRAFIGSFRSHYFSPLKLRFVPYIFRRRRITRRSGKRALSSSTFSPCLASLQQTHILLFCQFPGCCCSRECHKLENRRKLKVKGRTVAGELFFAIRLRFNFPHAFSVMAHTLVSIRMDEGSRCNALLIDGYI